MKVKQKFTWKDVLGLIAFIAIWCLIIFIAKNTFLQVAVIIIVVLGLIGGFAYRHFYGSYKKQVYQSLQQMQTCTKSLITEKDLTHLPSPVQKYLHYVGVVNKEKVNYMSFSSNGQMRDKKKDWFDFRSEQFNFFPVPTRLFFMNAQIGLPIAGFHAYTDGVASMEIKVMSVFPVVKLQGEDLDTAETVTFFNDMCLFAPGTLIDPRIDWQTIDDFTVKAHFTHKQKTISAILYFNETGQLINFVSDDRYYMDSDKTLKRFRWYTPMSNYKEFNGFRLPSYGEAIWHFPEGDFCYGKFQLQDINYNEPLGD